MDELIRILDDVQVAIAAAIWAVDKNDIANALYNIDHAEIDIMRARNLVVSIFHFGEEANEIP